MKISQVEARRLRKRVDELERVLDGQRNSYATDWPVGTHLGSVTWDWDKHLASAVYTARRLKHAVVVVSDGERSFKLFALPLPKA